MSDGLHPSHGRSRRSNLFQTLLPQRVEVLQAAHTGLLEEDRGIKAERMNGHYGRALENEQDLLTARTRCKRSSNVAARALRIQVRAGGIQADADQFDELDGQNSILPWIRRQLHALLRPLWIPFPQLVQRRRPGAYRLFIRRGLRLIASCCHIFIPLTRLLLTRSSLAALDVRVAPNDAFFLGLLVTKPYRASPGEPSEPVRQKPILVGHISHVRDEDLSRLVQRAARKIVSDARTAT